MAEVQASINPREPVTLEVFVAAPIDDPLDMTIKLTSNTTAVQSAVRAELADLIGRLPEALSLAVGENKKQIVTPTADVAHAAARCPLPAPQYCLPTCSSALTSERETRLKLLTKPEPGE